MTQVAFLVKLVVFVFVVVVVGDGVVGVGGSVGGVVAFDVAALSQS